MKRRGFSLVELMVGVSMMFVVVMAMMGLFTLTLRATRRTTADINTTQRNALALRRMSEVLRDAVTVSISSDGRTVTYQLPRYTTSNDPYTGERELYIPVQGDGVNRTFAVGTDGRLVDSNGNDVMLTGITLTDPEPTSTQYNQSYQPFTLSNIGSRRAISISIIASEKAGPLTRYARLKTTTLIRNSQ